MISVPGIGSGLDINAIVSGLVSAEGDAKTLLLANRRSDVEAEVSAFGGLKSIVSTLQSAATTLKSAATYEANSATSADKTVYTVTTSGTAAAGTYGIEVRDFAEAHKLMTTGFADQNTVVGTGILTISVGSDSFNVTIDSNNETLAGIRTAINDATDNTGVSATIINVDDGMGGTEAKLVLSSDDTGIANTITVTVDDDDLTDADNAGLSIFDSATQLSQINAAVDAEIYIDNQKVLSSSNTVVNAIEGVTLTLLKEDSGNVHDLTISTNNAQIESNIKLFVSNYNSLISYMGSITAFDSAEEIVGVLIGDATVRNLSNQIRSEINQAVTGITGSFTTLVDLGITSTSDGTLKIDETALDSALSSKLTDVAELFSSTDGIATRLENTLKQYTQADGLIDNKTSGLNKSIESIDDDLADLELSLTALEERLLAQFTALDVLVTQLNSTSNFLTQQFEQTANLIGNQSN